MQIIKRSGTKEEFFFDKVKQSLAASSDEAGEPLNESDLHELVRELEQILSGKESATSQQVVVIVSGILYTQGYFSTLEHYLSYNRKRI